ncbi:ribosome small subunit-dependent GTPase A [Alicyclobacillus acidiphilus]|uniref:ribosome small subunit-dependent GTPase A n=1 Tax=Alicyclobacillus acidiphilus TaxID=182455 RepID=UPI00082D59A6|nr:ribosome small subunit-dependent GTPase A [Alicyclobacillus acidiphilus]
MAQGRVIRAISGFFDVQGDDGVRRCRARGVFKKNGVTVLVGDQVAYEPIGSREGIITEVLPRVNELIRPPIANVDHVLVVFSLVTPDLSTLMLDKTIIAAMLAGVRPSVILTKADLAPADEAERIRCIYEQCGYTALTVALKEGVGIEEVRRLMKGRVNVVAGPSGAGKSTLANALAPNLRLQMGEVSEKIGRGKQTTRHVELFQLEQDTWLADAPGFSQLQLDVDSRELRLHFPDFQEAAESCPYRGCLHIDEEDCGVKRWAEQGNIAQSRYDSYRQLYFEIREREMNEY